MSQNYQTRASEQKLNEQLDLTRRSLVKAFFGMAASAVLFGLPRSADAAQATQETLDALSDAEAELEKVQAQLDDIAAQYESLSKEQDKTLDQIESVQAEIDATQDEIDKKQEQLEKRQGELSSRVSSSYKSGNVDILNLLLSSESFEELIANTRYIDKINENDRKIIDDVRTIKAELETKKADLETQKAELETLKAQQEEQLTQMQAKQAEVAELVNNLSSDVKELMEKRDAEIVAAAEAEAEAERQRKEAEAAAAAAAAAASSSSSSNSTGSKAGNVTNGTAQSSASTGSQSAVVAACKSTPSPGNGLCAAWVTYVFVNAGVGSFSGNANDMYNAYCTSSDKNNLKVGMIVAVSTHSHTVMGSIYGHIGIYIGGGMMMDNIGYIRTISIDEWINWYSTTVTPRWGWLGGVALS